MGRGGGVSDMKRVEVMATVGPAVVAVAKGRVAAAVSVGQTPHAGLRLRRTPWRAHMRGNWAHLASSDLRTTEKRRAPTSPWPWSLPRERFSGVQLLEGYLVTRQ